VLQEILLAKKAILFCGTLHAPFDVILELGAMIMSSNCAVLLGAHELSPKSNIVEKQGLDWLSKEMVESVEQSSAMLGLVKEIKGDLAANRKHEIVRILGLIMLSRVTDNRDKVYGILGFNPDIVGVGKSEAEPSIAVDYRLSTEQVYTTATVAIAHRRRNLEILSLVCDANSRKLCDLPYWCPDHSIDTLLLTNASGNAYSGYNTGPLWKQLPTPGYRFDSDGRSLVVEGF
jgi:hypothetical protein